MRNLWLFAVLIGLTLLSLPTLAASPRHAHSRQGMRHDRYHRYHRMHYGKRGTPLNKIVRHIPKAPRVGHPINMPPN